jgi:transcriptional regulator with XRE-family HTH domain
MPRKLSAQTAARDPIRKPPHVDDKEVANRLRLARLGLGLSQEEAGERIGISHQQVQKYETGKSLPRYSRLQQFADAYGVPISSLIPGMDHTTANGGTPNAVPFVQSRSAAIILRRFETIRSPKARAAIVDLVDSLAEAEPPKPPKP